MRLVTGPRELVEETSDGSNCQVWGSVWFGGVNVIDAEVAGALLSRRGVASGAFVC
jgi:hypothetical protein